MGNVFASRRMDGMAPIERAIVFLVAMAASQALFVAFKLGPDDGLRWYELVFSFAVAIIVGLASDLRMLLRVAVVTVALALDQHLIDMLLKRPDAFDWGQNVASTVADVVFATVLPWLDPPGGLRRWSRQQSWPWALYWPLAVLLEFAGFWGILFFFLVPITLANSGGGRLTLVLVGLCILLSPLNFLVLANLRADGRARSGGNVLFLHALDTVTDIETLKRLVERLAPYRIWAVDLDRRPAAEQGGKWYGAMIVTLWVLLPLALIFAVVDIAAYGISNAKALRGIVIALGAGARLYIHHKKRWASQERLGRGSLLSLSLSPQTLDQKRRELGQWCGLALVDLSREGEVSENELAWLEKKYLGRTIVLLPETAPLSQAALRLGAPVVRYDSVNDPGLADRLRGALDARATASPPRSGFR
jgi:hypothetical protein